MSKVLICAQSNVAIDEILTRILSQGIYDQNGKKVPGKLQGINIVRLGKSTDPLLKDRTLLALYEERKK